MTDAQAVRCRKRLEQFLVDLLEPVGRSERRHWGEVYVRSLLLDGERKSIEPLATRLPEGNVQAMQQFIGQSPWEWNPVWERLAGCGKRDLEGRNTPNPLVAERRINNLRVLVSAIPTRESVFPQPARPVTL